MTREEFDQIIKDDFKYLKKRVRYYTSKDNNNVEDDVIGWAYEETLKSVEKIGTKKQLRQMFIQNVKMSTIWSNSSYHNRKPREKSSDNLEHKIFDLWENERHEDIIGDYLKVCSRDDKMLLGLISQGHDNCLKLERITGIPKSTAYLMLKKLKQNIKQFKNEKVHS